MPSPKERKNNISEFKLNSSANSNIYLHECAPAAPKLSDTDVQSSSLITLKASYSLRLAICATVVSGLEIPSSGGVIWQGLNGAMFAYGKKCALTPESKAVSGACTGWMDGRVGWLALRDN